MPVAAETVAWVAARDKTPALLMVTLLPKETAPPPESPVPAVTVTDEFAKLAFILAEAHFLTVDLGIGFMPPVFQYRDRGARGNAGQDGIVAVADPVFFIMKGAAGKALEGQ